MATRAREGSVQESLKISIILPTRNEEKTIGTCLDLLVKQTYRNLEIIIVDNSCDRTTEIIFEYQRNYPSLFKVFRPKTLGVGVARNVGLKALTGDIVGFIDADDVPSLNYVEEAVKPFYSSNQLIGVRTKCILLPPKSLFGRLLHNYQKVFDSGENILWPRFFRRSLIKLVGDFDETLRTYEDYDFFVRAQQKLNELGVDRWVQHASNAVFYANWEDGNGLDVLSKHFKKCMWYGNGFWRIMKKYPRTFFIRLLGMLYLGSVPLMLMILFAFKHYVPLFLLLPFFLSWPICWCKAYRAGASKKWALLLPPLMIFKALGHLFGMVKEV